MIKKDLIKELQTIAISGISDLVSEKIAHLITKIEEEGLSDPKLKALRLSPEQWLFIQMLLSVVNIDKFTKNLEPNDWFHVKDFNDLRSKVDAIVAQKEIEGKL